MYITNNGPFNVAKNCWIWSAQVADSFVGMDICYRKGFAVLKQTPHQQSAEAG
jgi:hypothetical protein